MFAKSKGASRLRCAVSYLTLATACGLATAAAAAGPANPGDAQAGSTPSNTTPASAPSTEVQQIVVTAQRRAQNIEDVPIAVTALTKRTLEVNRVQRVTDLTLLAPGFYVTPTGGAEQIPIFNMRGTTSFGSTPGTDKAISVYLDGVYISSPNGSIFNLPDVSDIEVLRGPQGTLFGRNATGGAISVTTRDPTGRFGIQEDLSAGNYNQFYNRTSIDLPAWGPFSAYVSYVHNYMQGDVKNVGASTVWNLENSTTSQVPKTLVSPKWLDGTDTDGVFLAIKFAPTNQFSTVNKFDYTVGDSVPQATGFLGAAPATAAILGAFFDVSLPPSDPTRPKELNNSFSTPTVQTNWGDSLTSTYQGDNFTIKNIAAYRSYFLYDTNQLDGLGGLTSYGVPFTILGLSNLDYGFQTSDELNAVYRSKFLTLTVGGIAFHSSDAAGGIPGIAEDDEFIFGNVLPSGESRYTNKATSAAIYAQAEFHVTDQITIVGGYRFTEDWKSGVVDLLPAPTAPGYSPSFRYTDSRPTYLIGVNYKPTDDILLYAKYSTAYVSGGEVASVPFVPETAESWEAGLKGQFFDHRLQTNIALYDANYYNLQVTVDGASYPSGGPLLTKYPWIQQLGIFDLDQGGSVNAKGVEAEITAVLTDGVTAGTNISYNSTVNKDVSPLAYVGGDPQYPIAMPKWTVGFWGQYETTVAGNLTFTARMDANWRSVIYFANPAWIKQYPYFADSVSSPPAWLVNARVSVGGFTIGGVKAEVALWAKNLTDNASLTYAVPVPGTSASGVYQPARTFGVDLHLRY